MNPDLVTFRVGDVHYGVAIGSVHEVVSRCRIAPLPGLPPHVRGMLNLRGAILAVLDPAPLLGLPPCGGAAALVAKDGEELVAFVVREVGDVVPGDGYVLHPTPANVPPAVAALMVGVAAYGDETLCVLDMRLLLSAPGARYPGATA